MRITTTLFTLVALAIQAIPAAAQATTKPVAAPAAAKSAAIDSGMTRAQVITHLGTPAAERTRGEFTFMFYSNGIEKQVGMSDIVILQSDHVIDAILRSPSRSYTGSSSSPKAISGHDARKMVPPAKGRGGDR